MNTKYARHTGGDCRVDGSDRRSDYAEIIAYQRRQETCRTEAYVCRGNRPYAVNRGRVIEQHAAASVDLHVDESRKQPPARQVHHGRPTSAFIIGIDDCLDLRAIDKHGMSREESLRR